jgi:hypothetical protein
LSALSLILFPQCNIFETREPEPPSTTTSSFEPPVTPESVLRNFKSAIRENNPDNYLRCFTDMSVTPYEFIPSADIGPFFPAWTLAEENRYFRSMGSRLDGIPVLQESLQTLNFYSDSTFTMRYSLLFPHQDLQAPRFVQGNMQLHLVADDQGRWAIDRWIDIRLPAQPDSTWSYLKFWFNR